MAGPVYGEHARQVLGEYGFDGGEIEELITPNAVVEST